MKKLISIALSITIAVSVAMSAYIIPSHAIGYNKVVDNEFGGKTTYVATEYLDDYVQELEDEINEVGNKYRDRYHIHPWKGFLCQWIPILLAIGFHISLDFAVKMYNYIKLKNSLNANSQNPTSTKELWKKSSLSSLQKMFVGATSGIALFLGLVQSKINSPAVQNIDASFVFSKNYRIFSQLSDPEHPDFVESIKTFGAEIICRPSFPRDKLYMDCIVNSQKRFYIPGRKHYDPELAATLISDSTPKLGYINQ